MRKSYLVLGSAILALAACGCSGGGGGGGSVVPSGPISTPVPQSTFPSKSGDPQRIYGSTPNGVDTQTVQSVRLRALDDSPSPSPSTSPSPSPIPSPSGDPQIPARTAVANNPYFGGNGTSIISQVLDPNTLQPIPEPAPTAWTSDPTAIQITGTSTGTIPDAYGLSLFIHPVAPAPMKVAVVYPNSTGVVSLYLFDYWRLDCPGSKYPSTFPSGTVQLDFTSGQAKPVNDGSVTDMGFNCATQSLEFLHGYYDAGPTSPDVFGNYTQNLADIAQIPSTYTNADVQISMAKVSTLLYHILVFQDRDSGWHAMMISEYSGTNGVVNHLGGPDQTAGVTGLFPFYGQ